MELVIKRRCHVWNHGELSATGIGKRGSLLGLPMHTISLKFYSLHYVSSFALESTAPLQ